MTGATREDSALAHAEEHCITSKDKGRDLNGPPTIMCPIADVNLGLFVNNFDHIDRSPAPVAQTVSCRARDGEEAYRDAHGNEVTGGGSFEFRELGDAEFAAGKERNRLIRRTPYEEIFQHGVTLDWQLYDGLIDLDLPPSYAASKIAPTPPPSKALCVPGARAEQIRQGRRRALEAQARTDEAARKEAARLAAQETRTCRELGWDLLGIPIGSELVSSLRLIKSRPDYVKGDMQYYRWAPIPCFSERWPRGVGYALYSGDDVPPLTVGEASAPLSGLEHMGDLEYNVRLNLVPVHDGPRGTWRTDPEAREAFVAWLRAFPPKGRGWGLMHSARVGVWAFGLRADVAGGAIVQVYGENPSHVAGLTIAASKGPAFIPWGSMVPPPVEPPAYMALVPQVEAFLVGRDAFTSEEIAAHLDVPVDSQDLAAACRHVGLVKTRKQVEGSRGYRWERAST
jgi:hypothetical protein